MTTPAIDPATGQPECPHCHAIGDQPHTDYCPSARGWQHTTKPEDVQL